jgi:hypothetical protein
MGRSRRLGILAAAIAALALLVVPGAAGAQAPV